MASSSIQLPLSLTLCTFFINPGSIQEQVDSIWINRMPTVSISSIIRSIRTWSNQIKKYQSIAPPICSTLLGFGKKPPLPPERRKALIFIPSHLESSMDESQGTKDTVELLTIPTYTAWRQRYIVRTCKCAQTTWSLRWRMIGHFNGRARSSREKPLHHATVWRVLVNSFTESEYVHERHVDQSAFNFSSLTLTKQVN